MLDFYAYLQDLCAILRLIVVHCIAGSPCTLAGNPKLDASMLRMDVGKVVCDACNQDGVPTAFCSCWSSWSLRHAEMPTPHGQPGMLNKGGLLGPSPHYQLVHTSDSSWPPYDSWHSFRTVCCFDEAFDGASPAQSIRPSVTRRQADAGECCLALSHLRSAL